MGKMKIKDRAIRYLKKNVNWGRDPNYFACQIIIDLYKNAKNKDNLTEEEKEVFRFLCTCKNNIESIRRIIRQVQEKNITLRDPEYDKRREKTAKKWQKQAIKGFDF